MSTPIESLVANVNAQTQRDTLQSIGAQQSARRQVADKSSAINAICDNADGQACTNFFSELAGNGVSEDLLTEDNGLIDKVSERLEAVVGLNAAESAIRKCLCRREGRDPATFADLNAVSSDQGLMQSISARQESSSILARSQKASAAASASQIAMQEVAASQIAMQEVAASQIAMQEVAPSQTAIQEVAASQTAMQEVAASQTAMQEVAASQTAMQEVTASATARGEIIPSATAMGEVAASATAMSAIAGDQTFMQEVAASQTAMQEVAASQTAMQEVTASQTARDEVFASQTALQEVAASQAALEEVAASQPAGDAVASNGTAVSVIQSASSSGNNFVPGPSNAPIYIASLNGAGGGGGDRGFGISGRRGGDTSFHRSTAEGGIGGSENRGTPTDGSGDVDFPDVAISIQEGGGGRGGEGFQDATPGGDGGFVKALIMNPGRDFLSLEIGDGGEQGQRGREASDGSATIFTPNVF